MMKSVFNDSRALWVSCFSLIVVFSINFYTGMIMYAEYNDCDPLRSKVLKKSNKIKCIMHPSLAMEF